MMLVGLFVRHYKIYKNINYIPISNGDMFTSYIGDNGVGKSTILEALDMIFNHTNHNDWSINRQAKMEGGIAEPFIVPVFLLKNNSLPDRRKADRNYKKKVLQLSDYFWNTKYKTSTSTLDDFYEHRQKLSDEFNKEEYSLIVAGRQQRDTKGIYFASFHKYSELFQVLNLNVEDYEDEELEDELQIYLNGVLEYILDQFSYIYIPVETDIPSYSKLETESMQKLMDKSIQEEIENAIKNKSVDQINKNLDSFLSEIEETLEGYVYKGTYKNSLTKKDLVSKTIEAYFGIKILHRVTGSADLPINKLSSGEKRKALINLAYSFLMKGDERKKQVILAIDEPESSLHIANSYDQFEKVRELADNDSQILITTHWYGFIPILSGGELHSLTITEENDVNIVTIPLYNFREHVKHLRERSRGQLPNTVQLKSKADLVQSIISSLQAKNPYNWIICEGLSEKIYFEFYFSELIEKKNLRILPVGGAKEVLRMYKYLKAPLDDDELNTGGTIICLTDTDEKLVTTNCESIDNLYPLRLLNKNHDKTILKKIDHVDVSPATEIEDSLNPTDFYRTLKTFDDPTIQKLLENNPKRKGAPNSRLVLDLRPTDQKKLENFFDRDGNKVKFARRYVEQVKSRSRHKIPEWIEELKEKILADE